jgi:hypothetical protein
MRKIMKRIVLLLVILAFGSTPALRAQDHGQIGAFGDYYWLNATHTSFGGLGARISASAWKYIHLEGELAYDFDQSFNEGFTNPATNVVIVQRSDLRLLRAEFGPKFETPGPMKLFVTVKGGVDNFHFNPAPVTFANFGDSAAPLRAGTTDGVLYLGTGVEGFIGPVGVRLDVGDDMYFNGATHANNNLRISFGPQFRF